jgi:hypothetical protein
MGGQYKTVADALTSGADPAMLCQTCPWDRYCITPPTMTSDDIKRMQAEAEAKERAAGEKDKMPIGSLLTALVFGGRDTQAELCPVFAVRLKAASGKQISEMLKSFNQGIIEP